MAESIAKYKPGETITCHASAAVIGGRLVAISGAPVDGNPRVAHAGAGVVSFGVAMTDAASGEKVGVYASPGTVAPVEAGAAVAAGDPISSNATGQAITRPGAAPNAVSGQAIEAGTSGNLFLAKIGPYTP